MNKKIAIFSCVFALILAISVCLSFAAQPCEHSYKDDGNCTSPAYCLKCDKLMYVQPEHSYNTTVSYEFTNGNMLLGGQKTLQCSNTGCTATKVADVYPFIDPLGYAIKEVDKNGLSIATLISSYSINASEIDTFAKVHGKVIEYGVVCFIPERMKDDPPILPDGTPDVTAIKLKLNGTNGVSDLAVPNIPENKYDEKIVFSAYLIIDGTVYYIQNNELNSDYSQLVAVSCNDVLSKLSEN